MGKVFTWNEVKEKKVPGPENFEIVAQAIRQTLKTDPYVIFATLFGSMVNGGADIRSDIDCFLLYDAEHELLIMKALHDLQYMAKHHHVPVNFVPCDTTIAQTHMHLFGPLFRQHLYMAGLAGGGIKCDVEKSFAPSITPRQEAEEFFRAKMYTLQEGYSEVLYASDEKQASVLKKSLEAPIHIARKILGALCHKVDGTKSEILQAYQKRAPACLVEQLRYLVEVDARYTRDLKRHLLVRHEAEYRNTLKLLVTQVPHAISFVRGNIVWFNDELA
jgi:predicted nucleotidyltransferase